MPKATAKKLRDESRSLREDSALLRAKGAAAMLRAHRLALRIKRRKRAKAD